MLVPLVLVALTLWQAPVSAVIAKADQAPWAQPWTMFVDQQHVCRAGYMGVSFDGVNYAVQTLVVCDCPAGLAVDLADPGIAAWISANDPSPQPYPIGCT